MYLVCAAAKFKPGTRPYGSVARPAGQSARRPPNVGPAGKVLR